MTRPSITLALALGISRVGSEPWDNQCFWPNGAPAPEQAPCNALADVSYCCGVYDICLDNGYCLQTSNIWSNRLGRASCTDQTWQSPTCPYYCQDGEFRELWNSEPRTLSTDWWIKVYDNGSTSLFLAYDTPNGAFCCHLNYNLTSGQCQLPTRGSYQPFDLPSSRVINNRTDGSVLSNRTTNNTVGTTPSRNTSSGRSLVAVVAGIAVPLGSVLVATAAMAILLWRRNMRLRRRLQEQVMPLSQREVTLQNSLPVGNELRSDERCAEQTDHPYSMQLRYELSSKPLAEFDGTGI